MRTRRRFIFGIVALLFLLSAEGEAHVVEPLAPDAQATHRAVTSGAWSSSDTWGGAVPDTDARVIIPSGLVVTVDQQVGPDLFWIRVDGTLTFASNVNTSLTADTVFVNHGGRLEMGTAQSPVQADRTAKLIIKPRNGNAIDHSWDPLEFSRGVVAESPIEMHGAQKTSWTSITAIPDEGTQTLHLDDAPSGWRSGDTLVLTAPVYGEDETFSIVSVNGTTVTLDRPITYARVLPKKDMILHVANLTRNVYIESADAGNLKLQGHVMLMGAGHEIRYAGFYGLGRTTIRPVSDPVLVNGERDPSLMPLCGLTEENVRGRYALHFHMGGPASERSVVMGSAVSVSRGAGLKIGYINHSSNVSFQQNVSYQIDGSHFMTEEGDEVGEFVENLAIHSTGSNSSSDDQPRDVCTKWKYPQIFERRRLDVGHRGHGFWIHSGGVEVVGNVSAAHGSSTFELWTRPLNHPKKKDTFEIQFPVALLNDGGAWAAPKTTIGIEFVPTIWRDNSGYVTSEQKNARKAALSIHYHGIHQKKTYPGSPKNLISGFVGWNTRHGVVTTYVGWFKFENIELTAGLYEKQQTLGMVLSKQGGNNADLQNVFLYGFKFPLKLGVDSTCLNVIADGVLVTCDGALQSAALPVIPENERSEDDDEEDDTDGNRGKPKDGGAAPRGSGGKGRGK